MKDVLRNPTDTDDAPRQHFVRGAVRVRHEAIGRRIRLVISGYSKDVAQGLKIQRKAHKTPESFQEAA